MNCRCRRRMKSAPGAVSSRRRNILKNGACRSCSGWRRSALDVVKRKRIKARQPRSAGRRALRSRRSSGCPDGRCRRRCAPTRFPNTPNARCRRVWTSTAGRRLCITTAKRTSSTSRPSCAGRRTEPGLTAETASDRRRSGRRPLRGRGTGLAGVLWISCSPPARTDSRGIEIARESLRHTADESAARRR